MTILFLSTDYVEDYTAITKYRNLTEPNGPQK
jgi:hypothetical protein